MILEEYISEQFELLNEFRINWPLYVAGGAPVEMSPGDWDEQFQAFKDGHE